MHDGGSWTIKDQCEWIYFFYVSFGCKLIAPKVRELQARPPFTLRGPQKRVMRLGQVGDLNLLQLLFRPPVSLSSQCQDKLWS